MKRISSIDIKEIEYIIPTYIDNIGNCTQINMKSKNMLIYKSIKSVIKKFCEYEGVPYNISKTKYGEMLNLKHNTPVVFSSEDILIKIKTRVPLMKNDGAYGYFNIRNINNIRKKNDSQAMIIFKSGKEFIVLNSKQLIYKNLNKVKLIALILRQELEIEYYRRIEEKKYTIMEKEDHYREVPINQVLK